MPYDRACVEALHDIIVEVEVILSTTIDLPETGRPEARSLGRAARRFPPICSGPLSGNRDVHEPSLAGLGVYAQLLTVEVLDGRGGREASVEVDNGVAQD